MPRIAPIPAITYDVPEGADVSALIAPPYDVLDQERKDVLLGRNPHNIAAVDLPHLPAKTVGPDEVYAQAGRRFDDWLDLGVLRRHHDACVFVYRQTFQVGDRTMQRLGLMARVALEPLATGKDRPPGGAVFAHEQTFSAPKEDRLKLMRATGAQLSPIFGLHSDADGSVTAQLGQVCAARPATFHGATALDGVRHEVWAVPERTRQFVDAMGERDIFIADGHHRYNTALNYRSALEQQAPLGPDHPARFCFFVLVAIEDPGMIILPTHRVFGGMEDFDFGRFQAAAEGRLRIDAFKGGGIEQLESALPDAAPHAMGLVHGRGNDRRLWIATTCDADPLAATCPQRSAAWRQLDVAIVQHLIVDEICTRTFQLAAGGVQWKFPHGLDEVCRLTDDPAFSLGVVVQATRLDQVRQVSEAGDLMPPKSTFFYPKVATGLLMNPLSG